MTNGREMKFLGYSFPTPFRGSDKKPLQSGASGYSGVSYPSAQVSIHCMSKREREWETLKVIQKKHEEKTWEKVQTDIRM